MNALRNIAGFSHFSLDLRKSFILLLFVAYLFMGLLVMEQGRVIDLQKGLIRDLFADSMELSQLKMRQATSKR